MRINKTYLICGLLASTTLAVGSVICGKLPAVKSVKQITTDGALMPCFFPDGKSIAYVKPMDDGTKQLRILDLANKKSTALKKVKSADSPQVSPDGKWIAYMDGPVFSRQIWITDIAGNDKPRKVTQGRGFRANAKWIENGKRIAYIDGFPSGKRKTLAVDPFKKESKPQHIEKWSDAELTYSPDAKYIASVKLNSKGAAMLSIHDAQGKLLRKIPPVITSSGVIPRGCYHPCFSPDGRYMVYVYADIQPASDLNIIDRVTGKQARLTSDRADNQNPSFSPDGKSIVFVAAKQGQEHQLYLMRLK